jgi:hypothetical protein
MHPSLVLNAAIERLVAGDDATAESARTIIAYGAKLKCTGKFEISLTFPWHTNNSVQGATNEPGDVELDDKNETQKKIGRLIKKERIGHYRIWKNSGGYLIFHYFWASEIHTQGDESPPVRSFHLFYDPLSLIEVGYAEEYVYRVREIRFFRCAFTFTSHKFDVLYGSVPPQYKKEYSTENNQNPGAIRVFLYKTFRAIVM